MKPVRLVVRPASYGLPSSDPLSVGHMLRLRMLGAPASYISIEESVYPYAPDSGNLPVLYTERKVVPCADIGAALRAFDATLDLDASVAAGDIALMDYLNGAMRVATDYLLWSPSACYDRHSSVEYSQSLSFPLSLLLARKRRAQAEELARAHHVAEQGEAMRAIVRGFVMASARLGEHARFGNSLDALVPGFVTVFMKLDFAELLAFDFGAFLRQHFANLVVHAASVFEEHELLVEGEPFVLLPPEQVTELAAREPQGEAEVSLYQRVERVLEEFMESSREEEKRRAKEKKKSVSKTRWLVQLGTIGLAGLVLVSAMRRNKSKA